MVKYRYNMSCKYVLASGLLLCAIQPSIALSMEQQTSTNVMKLESSKQRISKPHSLETTISLNRENPKQTHPSKSDVNSNQDDALLSSEDRNEDNTKKFSKAQIGRIASSVRSCYTQDTVAKNYANNVAHMVVTVDNTGKARIVDFDSATKAKMNNDPAYRAFAEHSRDAVLNPKCSKLPIPSDMLGQRNTIKFVFKP